MRSSRSSQPYGAVPLALNGVAVLFLIAFVSKFAFQQRPIVLTIHNWSGKCAGDSDLVAASIVYAVKLFEVVGTALPAQSRSRLARRNAATPAVR